MSQAEFIEKLYIKNSRNMGAWQFSEGDQHDVSIKLDDYTVEPDRMNFESNDFPYFRIALLDKHLEETNAEK